MNYLIRLILLRKKKNWILQMTPGISNYQTSKRKERRTGIKDSKEILLNPANKPKVNHNVVRHRITNTHHLKDETGPNKGPDHHVLTVNQDLRALKVQDLRALKVNQDLRVLKVNPDPRM